MTATEAGPRDPGTDEPQRKPRVRQPGVGVGGKAIGLLNGGFLLLWGLITTLPLLWAILSSFKTNGEFRTDPTGLPGGIAWDNFARAWNAANIGQYFLNSVIVVAMSLTMTMLFGAMGAYVLARYDFPGNRIVYYVFVGGLMLPVFLALVPMFFVVRNMGNLPIVGQFLGLNSYLSLALVYVAFSMPFTVFFLTAFFRTLPNSVAEAGIMDGCSHFTLFFRIMLPMAKPGIISLALFNFLGHWNQYVLPLVIMQDGDKRVLAQGLGTLAANTGFRADYTALFAGLVIALMPVLIVYLLFQKQVQAGLTAGVLK
ncbi:N-acetylglucosamine transport system permease protein [Haloactinopolyspora alba]|uniref:N-acetylglucosamine transport system permease protein n=1 Tax=Haloactinopolyspora alba TaxID=648780 RepID=A0A2P8DY58_9ACTN|nr:carbohydrate ABC transporter permease [Haloactinopolyspora alba]PSL02161.1 N-acetylglucosamine transport system permease protein [Haloactinopolyspora alba]